MSSNHLTPLKAIKNKCLDCCSGQKKEVKLCNIVNCHLWQYRLGKRPKPTSKELTQKTAGFTEQKSEKMEIGRRDT